MSIIDFKCDSCGYVGEYIIYQGLAEGKAPTECPKCKGKMSRLFSIGKTMAFDIIGHCFTNDYGPKAWKRRLSPSDQVKVLTKDENNQYKDPY